MDMTKILKIIIPVVALSLGAIVGTLVFNKTSTPELSLGSFSDPFISLQLATGPANGNCLITDGTNNTWGSCSGVAGSNTNDWNKQTNFGTLTLTPSTTIPVWIKDALYASSTVTVGTVNDSVLLKSDRLDASGEFYVAGGAISGPTLNLFNGYIGLGFSAGGSSVNISDDITSNGLQLYGYGGAEYANLIITGALDANPGFVGIGTTSPYARLSVAGNVVADAFRATSTSVVSILQQLTATKATTTSLAVTSITSTLLKTNSTGGIIPALSGTDYQAAGSYALQATAINTTYPFLGGGDLSGSRTLSIAWVHPTTTANNWATGQMFYGSTTFNNATSTIFYAQSASFRNATTSSLQVTGTATSTFQNGVNLTTGCFAIGNVCVSGGGGTTYDYSVSTTWATTSPYSGVINLYPLNPNAVVSLSSSATTSATLWVDPPNATVNLGGSGSETGRISSTSSWLASSFGIGTSTPNSKLSVGGSTWLGGNTVATGTLNVWSDTTLARATSTGFAVTGLTNCDTIDTDGSGNLKCGTDSSGSGGGAGSVGTSSVPVLGNLAFWTNTGPTTALLGTVATSALTATAPVALSQPVSIIGSASSVLTCADASVSAKGCITTTDWTRFNDSVASTSIDTSAELRALLTDEVGTGFAVFNASPNFTGNVGIGTTTANWALQVAGTAPYFAITDTDAGTNAKHIILSNIDGIFRIGTSSDNYSATSSAFVLNPLGPASLSVGSSTPSKTITLVGTMAVSGLTVAAGTPSSLCLNGTEVTSNAALTCTVSSRRFKHDILDLPVSGIETIQKIEPVQFVYNDSTRARWGFIAEDLKAVFPELADAYEADGEPRSIDQNAILATVVKAVKEIIGWNNNQDERIKELEKRLNTLELSCKK
jgi:hypothetical protein